MLAAILLLSAALGLLWLLIKLLKKPIKWAFKLLLNALIGFVGLFLLNYLGSYVGISLGINWLNAVITGVFGVPGIVLLLLIKYIIL